MSDLRELIATEAVTIEEYAERRERSVHTVLAFSQGRIPRGADPFPQPVKKAGRTWLYCYSEVDAWLDRWSPTGRV